MKLRLRKSVKLFLLGLALSAVLANIGFSFKKVSHDELGNICYGGLIKVCGENDKIGRASCRERV